MTDEQIIDNGITLGFKLGRIEFLWDSPFQEAQDAFIPAIKEIYNALPEKIELNTENYKNFCESILLYYKFHDNLFYTVISVGISFFRCGLFFLTKKTGTEVEQLINSPIEQLSHPALSNNEELLSFIKSHAQDDLSIFIKLFIKEFATNKQSDIFTPNPMRIDKENNSSYNKKAFISYSSKNLEIAYSIRALLESHKISTWIAPNDIPVGETYAKVINNAIKNCSCFILILTSDSQNSQWVSKELERALSYKKTVLPIAFEDIKLNDEFKFYLCNSQILPVRKVDENSEPIKKLLYQINHIVD